MYAPNKNKSMTAINPQQLEGSWIGLATGLSINNCAGQKKSPNPDVEAAIARVQEIFNQDRMHKEGFARVYAEHITPK